MKLTSVSRKTILAVTLIISSLVTIDVSFASVRSISRELFIKIDNRDYWQVAVRCSQDRNPRYMVRKRNTSTWCAKDVPNFCSDGNNRSETKLKAADKVCSAEYTNLLKQGEKEQAEQASDDVSPPAASIEPAAVTTTPPTVINEIPETDNVAPVEPNKPEPPALLAEQRVQLVKEQMWIEEQRILIEQQKLELRVKELELRKRELEVKNSSNQAE